jgi:hypothetical protein
MKIYHGTNVEFGAIDLNKCPPNRDFGQGFYCTNIKKHALERAEDKVDEEGGKVTILEFNLEWTDFERINKNLKIKRFDTICAEWAEFVLLNRLRKESEPQHEYDIVEGPVANDKMFRQFQLYATNRIRLNELVRKIKFREETHQIAFCTESALDVLLDYNEPFRYKMEALVAELTVKLIQDYEISKIDALTTVYHSDIFAKINEEETCIHQKSWQEIYEILKLELKK